MKDYNSTKNQDIKRKFIDREVLCLFSYPMSACLAAGLDGASDMPSYDEVENYWVYPEYRGTYADFDGGTEDERDEEVARLREMHDQHLILRGEDNEEILEEINKLEDLDTEPQEIFEWWVVTEWLYDKLKAQGEPVIEWCNLHIWGRTCSGQAILLDHVISVICEDIGILEGQEHSWAE